MHPWLVLYAKGVCMGAADMVPGVSGGTIALIVGIYDRLVTAIAALDPRVLGALPALRDPSRRDAVLERLHAMDLPFLLLLGSGIATAVIVLSQAISLIFETAPAHINAFFFGLIGASAIVLYRDVSLTTPPRIVVAITGFTIAFVVAGLAASGVTGSLPVVFVAGAIAISAMLLPGISGAAFLYLLGQYEYMLDALGEFLSGFYAIATGGSPTAFLEASAIVATFLTGAVIGLLTTAHVVAFALARYRVATITFLVSLMVGALRLPIEEVYDHAGVPTGLTAVTIAATALLGILAVLALDRATATLSYT